MRLYKYRTWCVVEQKHETVWLEEGEAAPTVCPANPAHAIDANQTAIVGETGPNEITGEVFNKEHGDGLWQCDRDFKLTIAAKAADSFEDLKCNPITFAEEPWNELSCHGVFKLDGGTYVACPDGEVATNACLTVWDYNATDNFGNNIDIETRGGHLWVNPAISGDPWKHRIYSTAAPLIPSYLPPELGGGGGAIKFFDGYIHTAKGGIMESINPSAGPLYGGQNVELGRLRVAVYYPPGEAPISHVLRLITYRPLGTFK